MKSNNFKTVLATLIEADINDQLLDDLNDGTDSPEFTDPEVDAVNDSLDNDTDPSAYLADPSIDVDLKNAVDQRNNEMASIIKGWVIKIEEFTAFINGVENENSIQTILTKAEPGTLLAKLQASNSRKISKAAQELASLAESLKSFVGQKAVNAS